MDGLMEGVSARNKEMDNGLWIVSAIASYDRRRPGQAWTHARRRRHGKEPFCTNGRRDVRRLRSS
jgi:hypothetical protein